MGKVEKTGDAKKKWVEQALTMPYPVAFSAHSGTSPNVLLVTGVGQYMGDPFQEKSEYDNTVVSTTLDNFPVGVNKDNIRAWTTKEMSTDQKVLIKHFKTYKRLFPFPNNATEESVPVMPPLPTKLALFCRKRNRTYQQMTVRIDQFEACESAYPGITEGFRPIKNHCLMACQSKSSKVMLKVTLDPIFNVPKTLM